MCGITGWLTRSGAPGGSRERLARMCDAMRHRGPDAEGLWLEGPVALGMRRLAVIDVAGGQQPIANEDGTIHVVFNGEIYNHAALRDDLVARGHRLATRSDTEVLVHLYEEHGEGFLAHLTGMFAIALWDARRGRLLLARDRLGEKPLYWAEVDGELVFGSELKCLLAHGGLARALDLPALSAYLACEYVPAPRAILRGVHKLPPAHLLVADAEGVRLSPYWRLDLTPRAPAPTGEAAAGELADHLARAVGLQLVADVPLGVFLSGGIDSSTVAAVAARALRARGAGPLQTFSIGFADPSFDESAHARAVAAHIGSAHHERVLEPGMLPALLPTVTALLDEPFADASILPTHMLAAFAREHVTVALGGDGGDELFAGYPTYQAARAAGLLDGLPVGLRRALAAALRAGVGWLPVSHGNLSLDFKLKRFAGALAATPLARHATWLGAFEPALQARLLTADVRAALGDADARASQAAAWAAGEGLDGTARLLGVDLATYLPDDILFKVDRASMMASLETRAPLLDHHLVAWAAGLPSDLKLRGWQTKHLLKRVAAGLLPAAIVQRPKKGFGIPVARWLRGELRGTLLELLSAERLRAGGLFEPAFVEGLVREHLDGRVDHRKLLWTLMMFEWWRERYLLSRS
jgi:asparagine synthase (glutamine-hydrolysing)